VVAALLALAGTAGRSGAATVDGVIAIVHDAVITFQQVQNMVMPDIELLSRTYGNQPEVFKKKENETRIQAEQILVENQLILHDFRDSFKLPESIFDEDVKDEIHRRFNDRVQLIKRLENEGRTYEDFRKDFRDQLIINEMVHKFVPDPVISPVKIEDYYVANHNDFKVEDQINMRMIVLNKTGADSVEPVRRRANEVLALLKGGAAFPELARVYSEGSLRAQGGLTGWEDLSVVDKTLGAELVKIKPGENTGVIETADACYILKLEDRRPAHIKPLGEVRDEIERTLKLRERTRLRKKWIDRLRAKTYVSSFF